MPAAWHLHAAPAVAAGKRGKAKVRVAVTFTPIGGDANTESAKVRLRKR